jgi:hypothetical protein
MDDRPVEMANPDPRSRPRGGPKPPTEADPMRVLTTLCLTLLLTAPASAQEWKHQLAKSLVVIRAGKMVSEEYQLAKIHVPGFEASQVQLKIHAEAPAVGLISRDNFVSLTTQLVVVTFYAAYADVYKVPASQFIQAVDFTELAAPIGTPDLEINVFMTADGLQFEIVNTATGQRTRSTTTWAEVFAK